MHSLLISNNKSIYYQQIQYVSIMTFRSMQMAHFQIIMPREGAWQAVNELGQIDLAHIVDCGDPSNRPFFSQLKRCDQALGKIQLLDLAIKQGNLQVEQFDETEPMFVERLHQIWKQSAKKYGVEQLRLLDRIQNDVLQEWHRFQDIKIRIQKLKQGKKFILQQIACFQTAQSLFGERRNSEQYYRNNAVSEVMSDNFGGIAVMVGVVPADMQIRLNRMVYRVSRGYACLKTLDSFKFAGLRDFQEVVTMVIYPSSETTILEKKLKRVMETFCTNSFIISQMDVRNTAVELQRLSKEYYGVINLLELNNKQLGQFLQRVRKIQYLQNWRTYMWKERQLYTVLDKMDVREQFFRGQVYVPRDSAAQLGIKLSKMVPSPSLHEMPSDKPPTAFRVTNYTGTAQQITDTYGIPRYQEINPSIITCVTFPFFFGVMFGDIAHGGILLAFGIFLVFFDESVKRSPLKIFSALKYMITMMGFFAFYCGWIYNDFIGMNLNIFGSCFHPTPKPDEGGEADLIAKPLFPDKDCIYPFGLDPIWGRATNQLVYVNALKMKISVIIAVIHMTLGIVLKAFNALYFKRTIEFIFQFIPQIIFMVLLFGYMDFLIVFKWLKIWDQGANPERWAPSIITTMMNIGLKMGQTSTQPDGSSNMWGQHGNTSQDGIQLFILFVALICIPTMLLPKPIIEIQKNKKQRAQNPLIHQNMSDQLDLEQKLNPSQGSSIPQKHNNSHEQPSEIFVHQLIETIEFVLGAISNTASYLRLWALSLAHSQLAKVFFQKTLEAGYGPQTFMAVPLMIIGFYMLAWITFGILMCMDSMECFLHSLRLHWVEFQNKFYKGDGYKYEPFSFKSYIMQKKAKSQF